MKMLCARVLAHACIETLGFDDSTEEAFECWVNIINSASAFEVMREFSSFQKSLAID